jgi:hypothetical protein
MTVIFAVGSVADVAVRATLSVGAAVIPVTSLINDRSSLMAAVVPASVTGYAKPHATWL